MKIALINRVFSHSQGGGERYALDLAHGLVRAGCTVHLYGAVVEDAPLEAVVHLVSMPRRPASRRILSFASNVRKMLRAEEYDIVYGLTQLFPVDMSFMGGGVHKHWMKIRYPSRLFRCYRCITNPIHLVNLYQEAQLYKQRLPERVIANSKLCKRHVMAYYGVPENRIEVIYHGVDREVFNPGVREQYRQKQRQEMGVEDDDLLILFVSHNWRRKGLGTILQAVYHLGREGMKYRVMVVGKGRPKSFRKLSDQLGLGDRVRYFGASSNINRYYAAADVFALPTLYDPFAVVCLEAMGCGLPVVTSSANGAAEVINHGRDGFVLEQAHDWRTLALYLRQLSDHGFRERMGAAAGAAAGMYTHQQNVASTVEICREILRARSAETAYRTDSRPSLSGS